MYQPTKVKIVPLKGNLNSEGLVPLSLQFTQQRKVQRISLRKWIPLKEWVEESGLFIREKGTQPLPNARQLNFFLRSQLNRAENILLEFENRGETITFSQFKELFINSKNQNFIAFCEEELNKREESNKYSLETIRSNWSKLNKLRRFRPKLSFHELNLKFLQNYENYMRVEVGNDTNTIAAAMKFVRTMLNSARRQKLTKVYPFDNYKLVYKRDTRDRLNMEELAILHKLYDVATLPRNYQQVLQYFLFCCYTGLTWKDLVSLNYEEIEKQGNTYLINKRRHKTDQPFLVPILEKAKQLISIEKISGNVFPFIITNQKANAYIKKVIKLTPIRKHVTFHVGRHTFATVALNNGVPREVVQKMLGHASEAQTRHYSKVMDAYIIKSMEKWNYGLGGEDYQEQLSAETLGKYKALRTQLIAARIANGLSESDLARKIGVSSQQYREMEQGKIAFTLPRVIEIARVLDFSGVRLY